MAAEPKSVRIRHGPPGQDRRRAKAPEALNRFAVVMANVTRVSEANPGVVADAGAALPAKDRPILAAAVASGAGLGQVGTQVAVDSL